MTDKINRRLLIGATAMAVAAAVVLGWRSCVKAFDDAAEMLANEARSAAAGADRVLEAMIRDFDAEALEMEEFLSERTRSDEEITEYLQLRTHRLSTMVDASYVDLYCSHHGRYLCGNYWRPPAEYNPTVRPWYRMAVSAKGETQVSPPYAPVDLPNTMIAVARQLRAPETVLSLDVQLSAFEPKAIVSRGVRTGCRFFFESDGKPIDGAGVMTGIGRDLGRIAAAVCGSAGWAAGKELRLDVDSDIVFCARTRSGWGSVVAQDRAKLMEIACWALLEPIPWVLLAYIPFFLVLGFAKFRKVFLRNSVREVLGSLSVLLALFSVFLVLLWLGHRQFLQLEHRNAIASVEGQLHHALSPVASFVESACGAAGYCSRRIGRLLEKGATDERLAAETRELLGIYRSMPNCNYRSIFVARPGWFANSLGWKAPEDFRVEGQGFYKMALVNPNQDVVAPPYVSAVDGSGLITIARAVGDDLKTVVGIDVPFKMLQSLLQRVRLEGAIGSVTFFRNGGIVDRCDFGTNSRLYGGLDLKAIVGRAIREQDSFAFSTADGKTLYAVFAQLSQGLQMLVVGDDRMFSSELSPYRGKMLMAVIGLILGVMCVAFVVMRQLRRQRERELFALERAKNADRLEQALKMADAANQAKTTFLFNMSHDIRTPMNAIIGFTGIAMKHLGEPEVIKGCLGKTRQAGEMLMAIINSILDMSRIEAGKAKIEEVEGDILNSFAKLEASMQTLACAKSIKLSFSFGRLDDCRVYLDPDCCLRVFMNLISNAVKYTNPGGWVRVTCEQVPDEALRLEGYGRYRYIVADNGIGMSEEFQRHLFEQFTRERNSTASGIQGTGLGLAICKAYVDLMGGTIRCTSKQGEGTTFVLELPLRICEKQVSAAGAQTGKDGAPAGESASSFAGKRVLLVEDNELNREVSNHLLEELGFAVEDAEDGSVAVRMISEKGFDYYDFVLMDIQMPVMNGLEATKAIRKLEAERGATRHLPIIALSANAFAEDRQASLAAGMDAHVAKPIDVHRMLTVLSSLSASGAEYPKTTDGEEQEI